jgi:hypothetical protein
VIASEALTSFARGKISPVELQNALRDYITVHSDGEGTFRVEYSPKRELPHVTFSRADISAVLDRSIHGELGIEELSQWANLLTLLDAFDLEPGDEEPDDVWDVLDKVAHPKLSGIDEPWKLRDLQAGL